jgi:hypothetical protein
MDGDKANTDETLLQIGDQAHPGNVPEGHYGGHMERACACVDACGWSLEGLDGFICRRNGTRGSGIARLVTGRWGALRVPVGAVISFLAAPANFGVEKMTALPARLLVVVGSFMLFGLGTAVAMLEDQWRLSTSAGANTTVQQGTRKAGWSSANTWLDC